MPNIIDFGISKETLPILTNPATELDIILNKQAIGQNKEIITGIYMPIDLNNYGFILNYGTLLVSEINDITLSILPKTSLKITFSSTGATSRSGKLTCQIYEAIVPRGDYSSLATLGPGYIVEQGSVFASSSVDINVGSGGSNSFIFSPDDLSNYYYAIRISYNRTSGYLNGVKIIGEYL